MKPKKSKIDEILSSRRLYDPSVINVFYVIFIAISIMYGVLIWSAGVASRYDDSPPQVSMPSAMETKIKSLVSGYPIDRMAYYISQEDQKTAALLVGIAKKESNWGKFSPKKNGKECYNYWGYRGAYNQTYSGYSCFDSPKQAVRVVGERIDDLIEKDIDTPKELLVWKCGWSEACFATPEAEKWAQDVDLYYRKF
jgi:hypothetical protein